MILLELISRDWSEEGGLVTGITRTPTSRGTRRAKREKVQCVKLVKLKDEKRKGRLAHTGNHTGEEMHSVNQGPIGCSGSGGGGG